MTSAFSSVKPALPIEVFALMRAYTLDPFPQKVDLGPGSKYHMPIFITYLINMYTNKTKEI